MGATGSGWLDGPARPARRARRSLATTSDITEEDTIVRRLKPRPYALLVAAIALIVTLLPNLAPSAAVAAASPLDKPAAQLTTADLQQFVGLAAGNQITAAQVQAFIAKLSPAQQRTLRTLSEARIRDDAAKKPKPTPSTAPAPEQPAGTEDHGIPWSQLIEYQDPHTSPTLPWTHYTNTRYACDDQLDIEYILVFDVNSDDPDLNRWKTSIGSMYWYLWTTGALNLKAFGETQHHRIDMCISDTAVDTYGGGINNVKANTWIGRTLGTLYS
jgi:hypothetical protein